MKMEGKGKGKEGKENFNLFYISFPLTFLPVIFFSAICARAQPPAGALREEAAQSLP
jgi:hypothetical protein